jgi:predicted P-loop ATPase
MGSVNNITFLCDDTGNRRFLPFKATAINHSHDINMDNVYAEAYQLYRKGFKYWFDGDEIAEIEAHNEQYVDRSIEHELVEKYFEPALKGDKVILYTSTEICRMLAAEKLINMSNAAVQKIGSALRSLGYSRVKKDGRYKYAIKKQEEETTNPPYPNTDKQN